MWRTLDGAGLPHPPIPASLAPTLSLQEPWCWSTRDIDPMAMYMFGEYPAEVLLGMAPEYVAVSHAGHGVNSYALNYHIVLGGLAAFVQVLWGGVYGDAEADAAAVRDRFDRLARLIDLAAQSGSESGPDYPVLIVLDSAFRGVGVCTDVPYSLADSDNASRWISEQPTSSDPLEDAIARWSGQR